jgi:hypothetical protein
MKITNKQITELRTIEFKSHSLGEVYTLEILSRANYYENKNGFIYGGRILTIKDTYGNILDKHDRNVVESDYWTKIDRLNKKLIKQEKAEA